MTKRLKVLNVRLFQEDIEFFKRHLERDWGDLTRAIRNSFHRLIEDARMGRGDDTK